MMAIRKFSVITPCFNAEKYIEETILSVVKQNAVIQNRVELEYIICDGASTDLTVEIIKKYQDRYSIILISEKDKGMYDALYKGINRVTGEVCSYLNAGDFYSEFAFDIVLDAMESNDQISWLTGLNVFYNEKSHVVSVITPFRYRKSFILSGLYGTLLPAIQQESTFWKSDLLKNIDWEYFRKLKLAGDYYLWLNFCKVNKLYIVQAYLSGFKIHKGQLSGNLNSYITEMRQFTSPNLFLRIFALFDIACWLLPNRLKKFLNKVEFLRYDHVKQCWV